MNDDQPRRGDRVRFSVEGRVHRSTGAVISLSHEERVPLYDFYWPLCPGMTVEILERAKPPEPPGLGAVVRATISSGPPDLWVRVDHGGKAPWREVLSGAYDEDDARRRSWDQIPGPIEIVSPGVTEVTP